MAIYFAARLPASVEDLINHQLNVGHIAAPLSKVAPQAPTAGKSLKPSQPSLSGGGSVSLSSALCRGYTRQAATSAVFSDFKYSFKRILEYKIRLSYLPAAQWSRCQKSSLSA